jgi:serine/threonine-protein kinase
MMDDKPDPPKASTWEIVKPSASTEPSAEGAPEPKRAPIIGREWGNYRVTVQVGAGGWGEVYRLEHRQLPSVKAIKVMYPEPRRYMDHKRYQQEALAASAVDSTKIVRVDDVGEWPDARYIVMEYVEGRSLHADLVEQHRLPPLEAALKLLYRLADTLGLVHAKGIVHRDLTPRNILLVRDTYLPKICDFGVASAWMAPPQLKVMDTRGMGFGAAPGYQSPEQLMDLVTDGRTDIYSLGVIGYQMLTGELPHPMIRGRDVEDVREFLMRPTPSIAAQRHRALPLVPAIVEHVIARALAKDVSGRYTTALEFRDHLGKCLEAIGGPERNAMYTIMTRNSAVAPPLRTPAGELDEVIERLNGQSPRVGVGLPEERECEPNAPRVLLGPRPYVPI